MKDKIFKELKKTYENAEVRGDNIFINISEDDLHFSFVILTEDKIIRETNFSITADFDGTIKDCLEVIEDIKSSKLLQNLMS